MSKRNFRRAAEQRARNCNQPLIAQSVVESTPRLTSTECIAELKELSRDEELVNSPEIQTILDRVNEAHIHEAQASAAEPQTPTPTATAAAPALEQPTPTTPKTRFPSFPRVLILEFEDISDFHKLGFSMYKEHNPQTDTEQLLVDSMIRAYWLKERGRNLQEELLLNAGASEVNAKQLNLFLRYQAAHERSFYKALRELQNLKKQKAQEQIGFESQNRVQQAHDARVRLTNARAQNLEIDTACRQAMEVQIPGHERISFEELTQACSSAVAAIVYERQLKAAA